MHFHQKSEQVEHEWNGRKAKEIAPISSVWSLGCQSRIGDGCHQGCRDVENRVVVTGRRLHDENGENDFEERAKGKKELQKIGN